MKKLFLIFSLLFVFGCTGKYVTNDLKEGKARFFGGTYNDMYWKDNLVFSRYSWYYRIKLYYEVLMTRATPNSKFAQWFSPAEKEYFKRCKDLIVSVVYSADQNKISHSNFINQMETNGYEFVTVNTFAKHLSSHPSYVDWKLNRYKIFGHCLARSKKRPEKIAITFPGFKVAEFK